MKKKKVIKKSKPTKKDQPLLRTSEGTVEDVPKEVAP